MTKIIKKNPYPCECLFARAQFSNHKSYLQLKIIKLKKNGEKIIDFFFFIIIILNLERKTRNI